ncbi:MAG TPA: prolyl oligopeptidase family serine peptidase [Candidatus Acidoferrales bacterium]|jgi:prolyl oligopeptidase|nr:prolyl oligopeptidase family serine peptidase [Candidatus Acidoferrales bacterium]
MVIPSKIIAAFVLPILAVMSCRAQWNYPPTKTGDVSDTYFGKTYDDPCRWLEDLKDPEVGAWFRAQAELTDDTISKIPGRDALLKEWLALDKLKPAAYSDIRYENGRVFYKKTLGGENVGKLYWREGWNGPEKLLFDPGTYKAGVVTTIQSVVPSWNGKYVAMELSSGGAEWSETRVLDVDSGTLLPDRIYPTWGIYGWMKDGKSFFYDATKTNDIKSLDIELNNKTQVHRLGALVSADRDIFSDESNPELGITPKDSPAASIDESYPNYLIGGVYTVQRELWVFYAPVSELKHGKIKWNLLCQRSDNLVDRGLVFYGDYVYAVTDVGAPKFRVVRTSVKHPDWAQAETVIPEKEDSVQSISKSRHYLLVVYSNGVVDRLVKYDLATGQTTEVPLPMSGTIGVSCPDWKSDRCLVSITSWTKPVKIYDFDAQKDTFAKSIFNEDVTYPGFDQLVTKKVEVPGHDGAMIPLSIIYQKGIKLDGSNSCIMVGYGAYGISMTPGFDFRLSLATHGVVMAVAHVRGGSEKGEAWYKAGFKTTKPNTWKDFISCAEYLVKNGYTSPQRLAGTGTSAGGILISRAITERPDLFGAAVCNVGCANALRLEFTANGPGNTPEFGTVKDPVECQALYEMDGVAHVQKGVKYPAVMGVAGWNDPRVAPWQPGKFVAALQAASASGKPVLLKVNYDNGHFTEEKTVTFKNFAGQYAFMLWQTGNKDFQPVN